MLSPKLKEILASLTELMTPEPGERDQKAIGGSLTAIKEYAESEEAKGYTGTAELKEFSAQMDQLRKDVDDQAEQFRVLKRNGLALDGHRVKVLNHNEIMSLRKVHKVFRYEDQAEAFGAMACRAIFGGRADYADLIPERTRGLADEIVKQLDPGASGAGAELVAALYMADMIAHIEAVGIFFTQCDRVPLMTTGQTTWPKLTGELTAYPLAALARLTESAPTFETVNMTPVKWGVLTPIPNEFFKNPTLLVALGQRLAWMVTRAIAYGYDNAMVNGDGTADYGNITGVLEDANIAAITAGAATAIASYTGAEIGLVIAGISVDYADDLRWYMHLSSERTLRNLRSTTGTPLYERGSNGEPNTIDNYPYSTCQRFPAAGGVGAATKWGIFGDLQLSHYFGMMGGIEIAMSEHVRFEHDMTVIRGLAYADAALKDGNAVKTAKTHA